MTAARSNNPIVRNPVLGMPGMYILRNASPEVRHMVADILKGIAVDARARAEKSWRTHKAPMALYWKAVSVYANHIRRALEAGQ